MTDKRKRKAAMKRLGEQDSRSEMGKPKLQGNETSSQGISAGLKVGDGSNVNSVLDKDGMGLTRTETVSIGMKFDAISYISEYSRTHILFYIFT
jgi:hypothetical protein